MQKKFVIALLVFIICFVNLGVLNFGFNSTETKVSAPTTKNESVPVQASDYVNTLEGANDSMDDPEYLTSNEIALKDKYAPYYFSKLTNNYGWNTKDSCGYIAMGMLLSFWDTYWDDNIIEEKYEVAVKLDDEHVQSAVESPGIKREPDAIAMVSDSEYHANVLNSNYQNEYFQFKLMSFGNISVGNYLMWHNDYIDVLNDYIYDYRGYDESEVEIFGTTNNVRDTAILFIKLGIPVKLGIEGHAVVAYDYNEKKDQIYCHFGWGSDLTHVTIESQGYTEYKNLIAIRFKNQHKHSNNYYYNTKGYDESLCSCSSVLPSKIENLAYHYLDYLPIFKWDSLINENWFEDIGLHHELSILDSNRNLIYTKTNIFGNEYKLTEEEWKIAIDLPGSDFYIYIGIESDVDPYWDDYYYLQLFSEPTKYSNNYTQIKPNDWGFEGRYWFENEGIKTSTFFRGSLQISTRRLRCGYIENSYIILSPRRENAGEAYFEMNFDRKVYAFMYSVCLWSKNEVLDGIATIEVKDENGNWSQLVDIKAENELLPRTEGLNRYVVQCPSGIYGVRFKATATPVGTYNKGRLCIDDLVFCINPKHTNFISLDYEKTKP